MLQFDRAIELFSGSLDGALSAEEAAELEALLASSPEAHDLLAQLASDRRALRGLPPLKAPEDLKRRTLLKARVNPGAGARASGPSWGQRLLVAASLILVAGLFWYYRPLSTATGSRLHLMPGQMALRAAEMSQDVHLSASGAQKSHLMLAHGMSGKFKEGPARLHLSADAGEMKGGRLLARLAFDFDGNGEFDAHSEPQVHNLDSSTGFQKLAFTWPQLGGMKDLEKGKVRVELLADNEFGPPLKVRLEPEKALLELPFQGLSLPDA